MKFLWKDGRIDYRNVPDSLPRYWQRLRQDRDDFVWPLIFDEKSIDNETLNVVTFELKEYHEPFYGDVIDRQCEEI
jgi:hypothetical protein